MPLRVLTAALVVAVTVAAVPATARGRQVSPKQNLSADEAAVILIAFETFAAIRDKDARSLGRHLAAEFVYRTPADGDLPRAEFLRSLAALPYKILDVHGGNLKVSVYGDVAVLTGVQFAKIETADGKEETSMTAFTDVFRRRRGGRWLLTLAYGVEVPSPSPSSPAKGEGKP